MQKSYKEENLSIVYFVALGAFSLGMSSYITAGLIPFIQDDFNVSIALAAQLVTAFTLAYGIGSPLFVALLSEERQKEGILIAVFLFSLSNLISGLSQDYLTLIITRVFAGIGAGVYLAIGIAISTTLVSESFRGKSISIIMSGMAAGTVLGVPFGLIVSDIYGWQASMYIISFLGFISFLGLYFKVPKIKLEKQSFINKVKILKDKNVLKILTVSLIAAISSLGLYTYLFPILSYKDFGSVTNITLYLWVWGIGGIIGSYFIGYFSNKIKNLKLSAYIMLILSISLISLPFLASINPYLSLIPIAIWGAVGWALQVPQNDQLILVREKEGGGNLAIALNESALYLGGAIGSGLGGLIYYYNFTPWSLPIIAGLLAFICFVFQLTSLKEK